MWRIWENDDPPQCEYIIQSWDTAFEAKSRADYSACTTWGVFYHPDDSGNMQANIILLDAHREKMEFPTLKKRALEMYNYWQPDNVLIEAKAAITDMLGNNQFGEAGARVVIEEFLTGEEASFISMVDGRTALPMATSQDHKRVGDGDTGPNTGGMGAYSPAPVVTPEVHARVMREVVEPTVRGMISDGMPFTGFLYAGLMIDAAGAPKVIEFNVRFGDPETQPVMLRLQSDLSILIEAAIDGRLHATEARWDPRPALGVVMAAEHYPGTPRTGDVIHGLDIDAPPGSKLFHAGTVLEDGQVLTSGGRVLCATALGNSVAEAQNTAYTLADQINWLGEFHRSDIGWRAIERERLSRL